MEQSNTELQNSPQSLNNLSSSSPPTLDSQPASPAGGPTTHPQPNLPLILMLISLLFLFGTGGLFLGKYLYSPQPVIPIPTLTPKQTVIPTVTPDQTVYTEGTRSANWKTYTNTKLGFNFRYPDNLMLSQETNSSVTLNYVNDNYRNSITINFSKDSKNFTNYQSLKLCSTYTVAVDQFPPLCIASGKGWSQAEDIVDFQLSNTLAKSFYITFGPDSDTHIIQTTVDPKFEISMNVAGGGLDKLFTQILSTFQFLD